MAKRFITLTPRSKTYLNTNVSSIPLNIVQENGFEINPHISINTYELNNGVKYFQNNSGWCDSFKVTAVFSDKETIPVKSLIEYSPSSGKKYNKPVYAKKGERRRLITVLNYFIRNAIPFYVTTNAVGIDNKALWLITENKSRKQLGNNGIVEWDLTFTRYFSVNLGAFKNSTKKKKKKTTIPYKLEHWCKISVLKYSKKKTKIECVRLMQNILYHKGFLKSRSQIDGWYGKTTVNAVKAFQKKYSKKYKLKATGKVDTATFKALCSV